MVANSNREAFLSMHEEEITLSEPSNEHHLRENRWTQELTGTSSYSA